MTFTLQAVGDSAVKLDFPGNVSPEMNARIRDFCGKLAENRIDGVSEWVPAYRSIMIYYDPTRWKYREIAEKLQLLQEYDHHEAKTVSRLVHVPVWYGGDAGPDLQRVAAYHNLDEEDVIELHQEPEYLVYMQGFLPGFPYLGGLNKRIATPRLEEPRAKTFAGAVGIAHEQTGIYPVESPGGWNIIGKTPVRLFDPERGENGFLFRAGDLIRFYEVTAEEFAEIEVLVERGEFEIQIERGDENGENH
ncbi:5-oxoprolinase subunit PxpB [Lentibacillus sediminis]|uniref:5-oxoprolinase subunit PxpB n=1 Tax=Lentibacillus sediminis TaxID=1940529 RepID=UPI000C1BC8EC|nr:5-oxoprolinase subunit PxpB [Lentibacillus sediminis]